MLGDLKMFWRFSTGLRRFLQSPLTPDECRHIVDDSLRNRGRTFLRLLERAVFGYPKSPYLPLMKWAGIQYGDIERLVKEDGIERAMEVLYDAGVHVGLDEFKGRRPIRRQGLEVEVASEDFDNPLLAREFEVLSGGSTGPRQRMAIDFDLLTYDAACKYVSHQTHGVESWPFAIWRAIPPGSAGLKIGLMAAKFQNPLERWFTPHAPTWRPAMLKSAVFTACAVYGGRLWGGSIPVPEYVPLEDAGPVARWLAAKVRQGAPAMLSTPANSAVRVCMAAKEEDLDISDTMFRVGGEPFTEAKRRLVYSLGARSASGWAMSESGPLGGGCAHREVVDEVHLFSGKIAVLQHPKLLADGESKVDALYLTTLLTTTPKIMLNLDSGDYGVLGRRRCGCLLEQVGLDLHLHTIRSYEKLNTGGMHFMGGEIITLVEEVLPAAHGGYPTDYQFVEEEQDAVSRVSILISPRVGKVDEGKVLGTVLRFLGSRSRGDRMMAGHWQQGRTLRVVRREPYATAVGKIPPLRVLRGQNSTPARPGGRSGN